MRPSTRNATVLARAIGAVLAFSGILSADPADAACSSWVFADGFETADTSRWDNSPDPPRPGGTWTFALDFSGTLRPFALELVERPGGDIVGYLLGGTYERVVVGGAVSGTTVTLELELARPSDLRVVTLAGTLDRRSITGTASGDIASQPVVLARAYCELREQQLAAARLAGSPPEPEGVRRLAVVLDAEGAFVAGGFVGLEDCSLWACDGGLTSFTEAGDTITAGLETDGGCSAGSQFTVDWIGDGIWSGSYDFTDCLGTQSGSMIAATGMGTTSAEARAVLGARLEIAAAIEGGAPLPAPLPGLANSYLHFGKDEPDLRSELDAELAPYTGIEVTLERARDLFTRAHPRALADIVEPLGLKIEERRAGIVAPAPGPSVTFRDSGARPMIDDLASVALAPEGWRIAGNQVPGLDLPFVSTAPPGGARLEAPTPGGTVWISIGPYGTHFGPLTGDPSGEAKANFVGFLAEDDGDMEELLGNGDGIRQAGETWGFPIGGDLTGNAVRLRRPPFVAPADALVTSVRYETGPSPLHFDNEPQWKVELRLPGRVLHAFGHVGRIAAPLRTLVLAATGIDPDSFTGPVGTNLLAGQAPLPVAAGTELALPQLLADPVPGFPGYWVGGGAFLGWPWAQLEFQVPHSLGGDLGADFCPFRFYTSARRAELQATMDADMLDPASQRYRESEFHERWHWTSQGGLCQAENPLPLDFSDLYTRFGGWTERIEAGTTRDELFAFVPIDRTAAVYDPANYDSPDVTHLVLRNRQPGLFSWTMPDATVAIVYLPVGEVLERSDEAMLVQWRDLNASNPAVFQRLAYRLDASGLTIEWGNVASTAAGALPPTLLPGEPCDDTVVLCYDHALGAWPP